MGSLDGEKLWKELYNSLPTNLRSRFHRLNLRLQQEEPRLDNVSIMSELKRIASEALTDNPAIDQVKDSIKASSFYFEFEDIPQDIDGTYHCIGSIFCRLKLDRDRRRTLYQQLLETDSYFTIEGRRVPCVTSIPRGVPVFRRRVRFTTSSLGNALRILLGGTTTEPKLISGLPRSIKTLVQAQRLFAPFGRIDHKKPEKDLPSIPLKRRARELM